MHQHALEYYAQIDLCVVCVCGRGCSLNNNKIRTQSSEQKRSTSSRKKKWVKDNLDSALLLFD